MPRKPVASNSDPLPFVRSINVALDSRNPERIAHFRPTAKSALVLRHLLGETPERALLVVAPYGTGKSLAAAFGLHVLENLTEGRDVLAPVRERLAAVDAQLHEVVRRRSRSNHNALVLTLNGHVSNLTGALLEAATEGARRLGLGALVKRVSRLANDPPTDASLALKQLHALADETGFDRVVVLWDEFGRHLEGLVSTGSTGALHEVQGMAEVAARSGASPITLCMLLHRGLMHYASSLPPAAGAEWRRVEGRFATLQYIDDSREIYRLVSDVVAARRPATPTNVNFRRLAATALDLGLFRDFNAKELAPLLEAAYPLTPATFYLLPRLAARVAQNERTLFGFLHAQSFQQPITPGALYDYFSSVMQSDTSAGGTFKPWLETQSAIAKARDLDEGPEVLKASCLLSLGASGERSRTPRHLLSFAVDAFSAPGQSEAVIDELVGRHLLLHRRHTDDLTVWHGTDLDLRGKLEDEKRVRAGDFDLLSFLSKETPPPAWRPTEYNAEFGVRRFFAGRYCGVETLQGLLTSQADLGGPADGLIAYVVAESAEDVRAAEALAAGSSRERLIVATPRDAVPVADSALELASLLRLSLDTDLLASDPLVSAELQQMIDDARLHLQRLVDRLTSPSAGGPRWFHLQEELRVDGSPTLRLALSEVCRRAYPSTPKFFNEMIVRRRPSSIVINARKKLLMGILERSGAEDLGIRGQFPDASMLRTVLLRPGLYRQTPGGAWGYATAQEIEDPSLAAVWGTVQAFFSDPADSPKPVADHLNHLSNQPFGVREGLLPILFAAGLRAFGGSAAIQRDGQYLQDILPSDIELLCREPERFGVLVLALDADKEAYLNGVLRLFQVQPIAASGAPELLRLAFDALQGWWRALPPGACTVGEDLSQTTRLLREAVQQEADPVALFFRRIPAGMGLRDGAPRSWLDGLGGFKAEQERVLASYRDLGVTAVRRAVEVDSEGAHDLRSAAARWAACFDHPDLQAGLDGVAKGIVQRSRFPFATDVALLDALATLLVGKPTTRWDEGTLIAFQRDLTATVRRVEDAATQAQATATLSSEATARIGRLVAARIRHLTETLTHLVGAPEANRLLQGAAALRERRHGNAR